MKRGDVYLATLAPRSGSEQQGTRPVVVVSNDGLNAARGWRSVIVVPCSTSDKQVARGPSIVLLEQGAGGLPRASAVVCHQVTTIDRAKLTTRFGGLSSHDLRAVDDGLKAALDLE